MSSSKPTTRSARIAALLFVSAVLLVSVCTAKADLVDYTISYDPVSNTTTLTNSPDSVGDLEFWTRVGPYQGSPLFVAPGGSVSTDALGDISGQLTNPLDPTINQYFLKTETSQVIKTTGSATVYYVDAAGNEYIAVPVTPSITLTVPSGSTNVNVICNSGTTTCTADATVTLSANTEAIFMSSAWPGGAGQLNWELLYGTMSSVDDTTSWTSIYTPNVITGCMTPEPSTLVLFGIGAIGFLGYAWRRRKQVA